MNAKNRKIGSPRLVRFRFITFTTAFVLGGLMPLFCLGQATPAGMPMRGEQANWLFEHDVTEPDADPVKWEFEKHGGVIYSRGDSEELKCDVYVPESSEPTNFPAVIMIHGGAWRSGSKLHMIRHAWRLAGKGFVVMAINYRHAPRHKYPAQIEDAQQALAWLQRNADTYSVDAARVGVFGYSAGGHLGALMGTMATSSKDSLRGSGDLEPNGLLAVAVGGAPCEFSWIDRDSRALSYLFGDTRAAQPDIYLEASPLHHVQRSNVAFRIFHGKSDWLVPISTAKAFYQKLVEVGVDAEFETLDAGHFGAFSDFECFDRTIAFFRRELGTPEPKTTQSGTVHKRQD